jgi:hypothetical protein
MLVTDLPCTIARIKSRIYPYAWFAIERPDGIRIEDAVLCVHEDFDPRENQIGLPY